MEDVLLVQFFFWRISQSTKSQPQRQNAAKTMSLHHDECDYHKKGKEENKILLSV